jgi:hypothetical protein
MHQTSEHTQYKGLAGSQYHMYFSESHTKTPHRWPQANKTTFYKIFYVTNSISKHVSETRFCLRLLVKPTQLGLTDRASPYLWIDLSLVVRELNACKNFFLLISYNLH